MFILKQDEQVVMVAQTLEELLPLKRDFNTIEETQDDWQLVDGEYRIGGKTIEEKKDEIIEQRSARYSTEVDPITNHISRLRDEEQTPEIQAEINSLIAERSEKVAQIQKELPYPAE